ncbi:seryl-tRNA synthetase [Theileria orientalis strain Shintoku]|uniref:Serine--tRNA ligase n=1 Tax=Theileria orientalis strain Shintoku TaxID=869250 RepID=J7MGR2_THEOR|nr:LOW QUALITY PROTEIN: seryl-tRNA synthetase [Theileria orientalis strain Shintoku]BAM38681.1 seryl-tRNA synthetase [Theileria orientalis strain Shintoku]|eukprot:XP_009688982.1 LOW QUALITY PROTEIN: seryl-tRNA synthetase [Theileria orientalis strain Shintoku]
MFPELFQENFLKRGEDHWKVLIEIRSKYKIKRLIFDQIRHLEFEKVQASKRYYSTKDDRLREENIDLRNEIRDLNRKLDIIGEELDNLKNRLPNLLSPEVGLNSVLIKETLSDLDTKATIPHYEILERLSRGYIERGVSISGKGFSAYSGEVSRLSRALVNFMLDTLTRVFNYKEITVPLAVSESTLKSTGHLPRFEDHLFKIDSRNLFNGEVGYLIPTSEVPLIALHRNCKFKHLPVWVTSYSECFRAEIQDYGLETRGLIRQHQFGKVELVCFADGSDLREGVDCDLSHDTDSSPEASNNSAGSDYVHTLMLSHIEFLLNLLQLPHRQVLLSSEDTSSTAFKTVDFEVYMPSLGHFIEVSSCSNTRDYQTNNLNIRTRSGKNIHAINGSGLAVGRTLSALLENNCVIRDNGLIQINVPEALRPYLNNDSVIYEPRGGEMFTLKRYISNYKPIYRLSQKPRASPDYSNAAMSVRREQMFQSINKQNSKIMLDEADLKLKSVMEQRLFSALPDSWDSNKVTTLQKLISGTFLSVLFAGGIMANYYDSKSSNAPRTGEDGTHGGDADPNKQFSRTIISCEIHLLSSYLAFISGVQSGLQHYLGCGIVQVCP